MKDIIRKQFIKKEKKFEKIMRMQIKFKFIFDN